MYRVLRSSILDGAFPSGSRLPAHRELAARFGVAIMTVRQASGRLEQEGLIVSRQGRGTFVRSQAIPAVLIVDHGGAVRALLAGYIEWAGYRVVDASDADAAVRALSDDPAIVLVITGSRIPDQEAGVRLIRAVHCRRPGLLLACVPDHLQDLTALQGTAACPILIMSRPVRPQQIDDVLRLSLQAQFRQDSWGTQPQGFPHSA